MSQGLARDAVAMATTANKALRKNRQKIEGGFPHYLHGGAERERNSKSRITFQATASSGDRFAIILEFEFLSRIIASMQSMTCCAYAAANAPDS
jgi:hypothetical protein